MSSGEFGHCQSLIGQVGEAACTAGIGAMAHRAIIDEDAFAGRQCLRVFGNHIDRLVVELRECFCQFRIGNFLVEIVLRLRTPFRLAFKRTHAREPDQIGNAEHDGQIKQIDPPAWQRIVVFSQIAVPDMTRGLGIDGVALFALCRPPKQPDAGNNIADDEKNDVGRPGKAHGATSLSFSSGICAALLNS